MTIPNIFDFKSNNIPPGKGKILVAEPLMQGKHFTRSVILLTEHDRNGTIGFILNKPLSLNLNDLIDSFLQIESSIYTGGPVDADYLFYIHSLGELIPDSHFIKNGLYWGGNLATIKKMAEIKKITANDIKFFRGYSGWSPNQLTQELKEKSWLVSDLSTKIIMESPSKELWYRAVVSLGSHYKHWLNFPINPIYN